MLLSCFLLKIQHFKTSYVIVYHKYHFLVYMHLLYFKTSYVIVYLSGVMNLAAESGFQNILCYCLSFWRYEPCRRKRISKHLMLLFIMYRRPFPATAVCISKHLMLLFIYLAISGIVEFLKFQNILCYCLSISTAECRTNRIISKHLMLLFIVMQHRKRDQ